jgi:hypothetical protein
VEGPPSAKLRFDSLSKSITECFLVLAKWLVLVVSKYLTRTLKIPGNTRSCGLLQNLSSLLLSLSSISSHFSALYSSTYLKMVTVPLVLFLATIFISSLILFIGSLLNGTDLKYHRFKSPTCGNGLFIIQLPYSEFCCNDNYHSTDWVCMAAYDEINYILSSVFAWTIPIIPLMCTMATDLFYGYFNKTQKVHLRRLLFNVMVFLYRTVRTHVLTSSILTLSVVVVPVLYWWDH